MTREAARILWSISLHPLLILSALLALAYGFAAPPLYAAGAWPYAMAIFKVSSIILLALIAALERARLLTWALVWGGAGDVNLALGSDTFVAGALCFLFGHIFYIRLFLGASARDAYGAPWRLIGMLAIVIAGVAMHATLVPRDNPMFAPLGVYSGVLAIMTMSSFALPASRWLVMLGAVLFFISDGFVAANMFHRNADPMIAYWLSFAGWMIYWAAQACLCFGARTLHKAAPAP